MSPSPKKSQRGVALVALLVMVILAVTYGIYRSANIGGGQTKEHNTELQRLAQAKEAVIAYAVNDSKRPGRLLCPDLIEDGVSPLLSRDDCDAYGGWLPWKTLDLTESSDSQGGKFRYYLSPLFGGQRTTVLLNSDTPTSLRLDVTAGSSSNDIAAVIIATRGKLDPPNDDGDEFFYNGKTNTAEDNDIVIAITRQELMAAVEQRIANELRSCLEQHTTSPDNLQHTYPWPAPLSNTIFKGATKSLFGMVPDTQAGNPEMTLKESIARLTNLKNSLNSASTAAEQLTVVSQLQADTAYIRAIFDRLYLAAIDLASKGSKAQTDFSTLNASIVAATNNKTTFASQGSTLPAAFQTAYPSLSAFIETLKDNGFDLFLMELQAQNPTLKTSLDTAAANPSVANFDKLITPVNLFKNSLLDNGWTPNPEIETPLEAAYNAATSAAAAINAVRKTPTDILAEQAITETTRLYEANRLLESTILANRANISGDEFAFQAERVTSAVTSAQTESFSAQTLAVLTSTLESTKILLTSLSTASLSLNVARSASLTAVDAALSAAKAGSDHALISSAAGNTATQLNTLASALINSGDNIALETLKSVASALESYQQTAPANVSAGRDLRTPVKTVIYWGDIATTQAADLARLTRKGVTAKEDSEASAYKAASKLLDSLDGDTGSITQLDKYNKNNTEETARQAQEALNNTQTLLTDLLAAAARLDSSLETGMAEAGVPTVWHGNACLFLKPPTGSPTWWSANAWKNLFFYQISDRIRPAIGQLTVNGTGTHRAVVLAAGRSIWSTPTPTCDWQPQDRASTPRVAAAYLEGINNHALRNGDAQAPAKPFISGPLTSKNKTELEALAPGCLAPINIPADNKLPISTFNDRLAY